MSVTAWPARMTAASAAATNERSGGKAPSSEVLLRNTRQGPSDGDWRRSSPPMPTSGSIRAGALRGPPSGLRPPPPRGGRGGESGVPGGGEAERFLGHRRGQDGGDQVDQVADEEAVVGVGGGAGPAAQLARRQAHRR